MATAIASNAAHDSEAVRQYLLAADIVRTF
jgi:hypothetical protein